MQLLQHHRLQILKLVYVNKSYNKLPPFNGNRSHYVISKILLHSVDKLYYMHIYKNKAFTSPIAR